MRDFNPQPKVEPRILATDLDGTLIPLPENTANKEALRELSRLHDQEKFGLIFATGRHFESVLEAITLQDLPTPDWIICDVGSSIYRRIGSDYHVFEPYEKHLADTTAGTDREVVETLLSGIDGLEPQADEHQQRFKISYQTEAHLVEDLLETINQHMDAAELPYNCMGSIDPFLNAGLLDVLPKNVSKAYALIWLATHGDFTPDEIIYSGDSGNDLAALIAGFRAIIVANGSEGLAEKVRTALRKRDLEKRLYCAWGKATSGVLEGCRHFGLFKGGT